MMSLNCWPMVKTGFNADIGDWEIIDVPVRRSLRSSGFLISRTFFPRNSIFPFGTWI